jgi:hypothetical protein
MDYRSTRKCRREATVVLLFCVGSIAVGLATQHSALPANISNPATSKGPTIPKRDGRNVSNQQLAP